MAEVGGRWAPQLPRLFSLWGPMPGQKKQKKQAPTLEPLIKEGN